MWPNEALAWINNYVTGSGWREKSRERIGNEERNQILTRVMALDQELKYIK